VAIGHACKLAKLSETAWYYVTSKDQQESLRMRIREIANDRPRFGYTRIYAMLRREGWGVNLKRVHRLYRLEGLQVRMRRRRKKRLSLHRGMPPPASGPNERWSMDFVHDQLISGQAFRVLTVIDNWSRESVLLEVGFRLTGQSVADALNRVAKTHKPPATITVDHGSEFTSLILDEWAHNNQVAMSFTRPGKPTDNGLCESFNGRLRDECLNINEFKTLEDAQRIIEAWRCDYNEYRPHGSLGNLTPYEFKSKVRKPGRQ